MFKQKRIRYVDFDEMNKILEEVEKYTIIDYGEWKNDGFRSLSTHSYIDQGMVNFYVTTKWYGDMKPCTYITRLDGDKSLNVSPMECFKLLQRCYKARDITKDAEIMRYLSFNDKESIAQSAKPLIGYNKKFDNMKIYSYVYDLNSAYSSVLLGKIPDTDTYRMNDIVGENEVGFYFDDDMSIAETGDFAQIVFPLMDSPYRDFVTKWYTIKKNAKPGSPQKIKAKCMLNISIGYLQRRNPFIRAYVIHMCNKKIESLIDDNTIMWNTDAIYSCVPRPDLKIGNEIGEFKIEHECYIAYKGLNYQVFDDIDDYKVHYRGVPKSWFEEDYDILSDELPSGGNIYYFDKEKFRLCLSSKKD